MENPNQKAMDRILDDISSSLEMIKKIDGPLKKIDNIQALKKELELDAKLIDIISEFYEDKQLLDQSSASDTPTSDESTNTTQFLERAKDIEQEATYLHDGLDLAIKEDKKSKKTKKGARHQQMRERKKLFKTIGGDNKWLPL